MCGIVAVCKGRCVFYSRRMETDTRTVDVAIIGAGTAGLTARSAAKRAGCSSVLMIDEGPLGTTCARVGCMPSKLLVAAAAAAHQVEQAPLFGVHTEHVYVNGKEVFGRVRAERDRFVASVLRVIETARSDGEFIEGKAKLEAPGRLSIGSGEQVHFKRLIVASGGAPIVPAAFRGMGSELLTSDDVFELEDLPESVLVIGLGSIGLELGQAFHRLGVRVTLLGTGGGVGPLTDPEIVANARTVLGEELDLHPDYRLERWEPVSDNEHDRQRSGIVLHFVDSRGVKRVETFERVVMAAGRRPNLDGLGLEQYGVVATDGAYPIDRETLQLGETPVFVAGDANALHPLLHEATDDGRIAGKNAALYPDIDAPERRTPLGIVFCEPQIAIVGKSYEELAECGAVAGAVDYVDQGRARVNAMNQGSVRIYADHKTHCLLGAELFAPRAEHLAHLLAWAVQQNLTVQQALGMPFYHPVVEEGLRTALRNLAVNLGREVPLKCRVAELGVGS